jgi:hypothetical protein
VAEYTNAEHSAGLIEFAGRFEDGAKRPGISAQDKEDLQNTGAQLREIAWLLDEMFDPADVRELAAWAAGVTTTTDCYGSPPALARILAKLED